MSEAIWWFGALHAAVYALLGASVVIVLCFVKAHTFYKVMGRIIQWHWARARWKLGELREEPRP